MAELAYELEIKLNKAAKDLRKLANEIEDSLDKSGKKAGKQLSKDLAKGAKNTGLQMGDLISAGIIANIATSAIQSALSSAFDFGVDVFQTFVNIEDAMAGVAKTTGLAGEELDTLQQEILKLGRSTRTPVEELLTLAEGAGRLGIQGRENVVAFTESINKLNVALGDEFTGGAEQITAQVGVLSNVLKGLPVEDQAERLLRIGNALNTLGAEGAASAPVITDFSNRIGGLAGDLGASNILGLSAALQELGVTSERGGTSVGRIVQKMSNPENISEFAKVVGLTAKEFENLINTNPNEALLLVAEAAKQGSGSATAFAGTIDKLGLSGSGVSEVLQKIGDNTDFVREKQVLAADALENTESITDEYDKMNNTAAANLAKLGNMSTEAKLKIAAFGEEILNSIPGLDVLTKQILELATRFLDLDPTTVIENIKTAFGEEIDFSNLVDLDQVFKLLQEQFNIFTEETMPKVIEILQLFMTTLVDEVLPVVIPAYMQLVEEVLPAILPALNSILDFIILIFPIIQAAIQNFMAAWQIMADTVIGVVKGLVTIIGGVFEVLNGIMTGDGQKIREGFISIFEGLGTIVETVFKGVVNTVTNTLNGLIRQVNAIGDVAANAGIDIPNIPEIPKLFKGSTNLGGGAVIVGDQGPELLFPSRGMGVATAGETRNIVNNNNNSSNSTVNNYGSLATSDSFRFAIQ